jgi:hypothetical protein
MSRAGCRLLVPLSLIAVIASIGAPNTDALRRAVAAAFRVENFSGHISDALPGNPSPLAAMKTPAPAALSNQEVVGSDDTFPVLRTSLPVSQIVTIRVTSPQRGVVLSALYGSFLGLQVADVQSTLRGVNRGAHEVNPLMKPFASQPAAMTAVKAGAAAGVLLMADRVWRRNHLAGLIVMVAANSACATAVARNYRLAARLRDR